MRAWLIAAAFTSSFAALPAAAGNPCEAEMVDAAQRHGVPLPVLYAVGMTETGRKGSLQPWALNIEGKPVFARSRADAISIFNDAWRSGARLIDVGCMQINHRYHGKQFDSLESMFDPHRNVEYAARFLAQLHTENATWAMAVARYHAGADNNAAQQDYICSVIDNLVTSGFGAWTPQSRKFCAN